MERPRTADSSKVGGGSVSESGYIAIFISPSSCCVAHDASLRQVNVYYRLAVGVAAKTQPSAGFFQRDEEKSTPIDAIL